MKTKRIVVSGVMAIGGMLLAAALAGCGGGGGGDEVSAQDASQESNAEGTLDTLAAVSVTKLEGFELDLRGVTLDYYPKPPPDVYPPPDYAWKFSGTTGRGIQRNGSAFGAAPATERSQTAFLMGGDAHISTKVNLLKGVYRVELSAARRAWLGDEANPVQIKVNGTAVGTISPSGTAFARYSSNLFPLNTDGVYTIELVSTATGFRTTFVDDVSVVRQDAGPVYYVDAKAANDSGNGSINSPKKCIASAASLLPASGGGTLIVKPGTYSQACDLLQNQGSGSAGAWNVIKAETDGSAIVTAGLDMGLIDHYVQIEGLRFEGKVEKSITGRYVKVLRSTFKDGPPDGNTTKLVIGSDKTTPLTEYILLEDVYAYGSGGRYDVLVYNANKVVLRRVVLRHGTGWSPLDERGDDTGEPQAALSLYNSQDVLTQNVISLDSVAGAHFEADIFHPNNTRPSANIRNVGAIVLNSGSTGVSWDDSGTMTNGTLEDSAVINAGGSAVVVNGIGTKKVALKRVTLVKTGNHGVANYSNVTTANDFTIADSIVANWAVDQFKNAIGATNVSKDAPGWPLQAVSGRGATIMKVLGKSGTLWGEAGFDQATTTDLWPFPREAAIKKLMCTEAGVSTGVCAHASLTDYVKATVNNAR